MNLFRAFAVNTRSVEPVSQHGSQQHGGVELQGFARDIELHDLVGPLSSCGSSPRRKRTSNSQGGFSEPQSPRHHVAAGFARASTAPEEVRVSTAGRLPEERCAACHPLCDEASPHSTAASRPAAAHASDCGAPVCACKAVSAASIATHDMSKAHDGLPPLPGGVGWVLVSKTENAKVGLGGAWLPVADAARGAQTDQGPGPQLQPSDAATATAGPLGSTAALVPPAVANEAHKSHQRQQQQLGAVATRPDELSELQTDTAPSSSRDAGAMDHLSACWELVPSSVELSRGSSRPTTGSSSPSCVATPLLAAWSPQVRCCLEFACAQLAGRVDSARRLQELLTWGLDDERASLTDVLGSGVILCELVHSLAPTLLDDRAINLPPPTINGAPPTSSHCSSSSNRCNGRPACVEYGGLPAAAACENMVLCISSTRCLGNGAGHPAPVQLDVLMGEAGSAAQEAALAHQLQEVVTAGLLQSISLAAYPELAALQHPGESDSDLATLPRYALLERWLASNVTGGTALSKPAGGTPVGSSPAGHCCGDDDAPIAAALLTGAGGTGGRDRRYRMLSLYSALVQRLADVRGIALPERGETPDDSRCGCDSDGINTLDAASRIDAAADHSGRASAAPSPVSEADDGVHDRTGLGVGSKNQSYPAAAVPAAAAAAAIAASSSHHTADEGAEDASTSWSADVAWLADAARAVGCVCTVDAEAIACDDVGVHAVLLGSLFRAAHGPPAAPPAVPPVTPRDHSAVPPSAECSYNSDDAGTASPPSECESGLKPTPEEDPAAASLHATSSCPAGPAVTAEAAAKWSRSQHPHPISTRKSQPKRSGPMPLPSLDSCRKPLKSIPLVNSMSALLYDNDSSMEGGQGRLRPPGSSAGQSKSRQERLNDMWKGTQDDDLVDEQEERLLRMWINSLSEGLQLDSLFDDVMRTGWPLLQALEGIQPGCVSWGQAFIPPFKDQVSKIKSVQNCNQVVQVCAQKLRIPLVNLGGLDIAEGRRTAILSLVWQMMRHHVILKLDLVASPRTSSTGGSTAVRMGRPQLEEEILRWANARLAGQSLDTQSPQRHRIHGFSDPRLCEGAVLLALLAAIAPSAVDPRFVLPGRSAEERELNAKYVISLSRKLGCAVFLQARDIVEAKPKMMLMLLASLMALDLQRAALPGLAAASAVASRPLRTPVVHHPLMTSHVG